MFPVTIGSVTVDESSFSGLGYVTAFPQLVDTLGNYVARVPYSTSVTSVALGTGTKALVTGTYVKFYVGQPLIVQADSANFMEGTVASYNEATGDIEVNVNYVVGSGTYALWDLAPIAATDSVSVGVSRGAIPESSVARLRTSMEMDNPETSMKLCESTFFEPYEAASSSPFYVETAGTGAVVSEANVTYGLSGNGAGYWALVCSGADDEVGLSYGDQGFIYLGNGGDMEYVVRLMSPNITSGETVNFKLGLISNSTPLMDKHFESFGFGFESEYTGGYCKIYAVVNDGFSVIRKLMYSYNSPNLITLRLRFCSSNKTVRLANGNASVRDPYVGSYLDPTVLVVDLSEFFDVQTSRGSLSRSSSLLRPFFYCSKVGGGTYLSGIYLDAFYTYRQIQRAP